MMKGPKPTEMDGCSFALKDSNSQEEEEEKTKRKGKRKLCKNGKRVPEKKMLRAKDFHMKIPKERPEIWDPDGFHAPEGGGIVDRYDRVSDSSDPEKDELKSKLRSYADRAIQQYNKVQSMDYRLVDVETAAGYLCQGILYRMTFTAKLLNQDDCDAIAFMAEAYEGLFGEFEEVPLVCKEVDRPFRYEETWC